MSVLCLLQINSIIAAIAVNKPCTALTFSIFAISVQAVTQPWIDRYVAINRSFAFASAYINPKGKERSIATVFQNLEGGFISTGETTVRQPALKIGESLNSNRWQTALGNGIEVTSFSVAVVADCPTLQTR